MKPNILNRFLITQLLAAVCITSSAYAAVAIKGTVVTDLAATTAGAWTGGSGTNGSPTNLDVATWIPTSLGGALTVGSAVNWGSINIGGATANLSITSNQITTGNITLTGARTLSIANNIVLSGDSVYSIADVTLSSATDATLGAISGAFGVTKSGTGTLRLSGSSSYTGPTNVIAGTLNLTGSLTSSISVGSGATLTGSGTTTGDITFAAGSNILAAGTLPVQGVNVTVNATTNIFVTGAPTGSPATVAVIEHTGSLTGLANFTPATNYRAGSITDSSGTVSLEYTGEAKTWGDNDGTWGAGTASQWTGGSDDSFYWGDSVTFGTIFGDNIVTLTGQLAPTSVTVNNASSGTTHIFSGSGGITGPCSLSKSGIGMLEIATTNSYTGPTTLSGGELILTGAGALGATTGLTVSGGILNLGTTSQTVMGPVNVTAACWILDGSLTGTSYAVSNAAGLVTISTNLLANGAAGLTKSGAGTLELSGANTYTGATTLSAGAISLSEGDNRLPTTGTLNFTAASTLNVGSTQQSLDNLTIGNFNATVTGSGGKLTLTGTTFNVGSTVTSGTQQLLMGGTTPLSSFVYDNPAGTVNITSTVNNAAVASSVLTLGTTNVITASEINVAKFAAPNTTNNKGSNINMGQTNTLNADTITLGSGDRVAGTLQYSSANVLDSPSLTIRGTAGGTSRANMILGSQAGTTGSTPLAGTVNLVSFIDTGTSTVDAMLGTLTIGQNVRASTVNAATSNCNGVFRMGAGTVDATTILLGQDTDGFASSATADSVTNATFTTDTVATGFGLVKVNTLTMGDKRSDSIKMVVNSNFNLNNGGVLQAGTIADGSNAATTVTRTINWNDGTIKNYDSATDLNITSTATGAAALTIKLAATGTHTFDIDAARTATVSAVLADATTLGTLVKAGAGTLALNGVNTYTGSTTVNGGILSLSTAYLSDSAAVVIGANGVLNLNHNSTDLVGSLTIDGVLKAPGVYDSANSGGFITGSGKLQVVASGYGTWAATNAPSQTAGQDYDNDGVSNGAEWVLGGLATSNDAGKLPTVSTTTVPGSLVFTFVRDQASKTAGTAVSIQVGTTLAAWPFNYTVGNDTASSSPEVTVTPNGDGTDTVKLTVAQGADTKKFARLNVVITP